MGDADRRVRLVFSRRVLPDAVWLGASTASFVSMLEPVISVVFATVWFRDPVTVGITVGGILVIMSILLIIVDGQSKNVSRICS